MSLFVSQMTIICNYDVFYPTVGSSNGNCGQPHEHSRLQTHPNIHEQEQMSDLFTMCELISGSKFHPCRFLVEIPISHSHILVSEYRSPKY